MTFKIRYNTIQVDPFNVTIVIHISTIPGSLSSCQYKDKNLPLMLNCEWVKLLVFVGGSYTFSSLILKTS